jgi:hypothetical protein
MIIPLLTFVDRATRCVVNWFVGWEPNGDLVDFHSSVTGEYKNPMRDLSRKSRLTFDLASHRI